MGCATSNVSVSSVDIVADAYAVKIQTLTTRSHKKKYGKRQSVASRTEYSESLESYRSYASTSMNAPSSMMNLPDREMHEEHLLALDSFCDLVEKHPRRFANEIERARRYRFPSISDAPDQEWHKVYYSNLSAAALASNNEDERVDRKPSTYPSESRRCQAFRSRANICSTTSNDKGHSGKSTSLDVSISSTVTPAPSEIFDSASIGSSLSETDLIKL